MVRTFLVFLLALAAPAAAHHGWGGYDSGRLLTVTGTVRTFTYSNPHGELRLEASGKMWRVVLAPPGRMESRGLDRGMIKVGEQVTVEGYAHRNDPEEFRAERIRVADKVTELR